MECKCTMRTRLALVYKQSNLLSVAAAADVMADDSLAEWGWDGNDTEHNTPLDRADGRREKS